MVMQSAHVMYVFEFMRLKMIIRGNAVIIHNLPYSFSCIFMSLLNILSFCEIIAGWHLLMALIVKPHLLLVSSIRKSDTKIQK